MGIKTALVMIALVGLTGCITSNEPAPIAAAMPSSSVTRDQAQKMVLNERSRIWKDPYSIRDARSGDVVVCPARDNLFPPASSCMCVEANAKNSYGGYQGARRTVMIFTASGGLDTSDGGIKGFEDVCQNLTPFPALNGRG